jgi:hypothetical protein
VGSFAECQQQCRGQENSALPTVVLKLCQLPVPRSSHFVSTYQCLPCFPHVRDRSKTNPDPGGSGPGVIGFSSLRTLLSTTKQINRGECNKVITKTYLDGRASRESLWEETVSRKLGKPHFKPPAFREVPFRSSVQVPVWEHPRHLRIFKFCAKMLSPVSCTNMPPY